MIEIETQFPSSNTAVVHVSGEIDMDSSDDLREVLREAAEENFTEVIVDMQEVEFIDSSGIATLVESMQSLKQNGGQLVLRNLQENVRSVFDIANLLEVFTIRT